MMHFLIFWNSVENLACVTTDNGSNFIAVLLNQDVLRLLHFGHSLSLETTES